MSLHLEVLKSVLCDYCDTQGVVEVKRALGSGPIWICRACLGSALSAISGEWFSGLIPDGSPRLRAYLALAEAHHQLQTLVDGGEHGWGVGLDDAGNTLSALYDGLTTEEREIVDKREVQR